MRPRRAKHRSDDDFTDDDRPDESDLDERRPRRKRRTKAPPRKRRKLPWLLLLAVLLVALAPTIIAKTPLRQLVLAAAVPTDQLRVTVGDASLGWFRAPSLSQIRVTDAAGDTLLTADSLRLDQAPVNLLLNSRRLGLIEIVRPEIHLKIRADGNNLEDALRQALADVARPQPDPLADHTSSPPTEFALQVVDGTVVAEDAVTGRRWRIQELNLLYDARGADGGIGRTNFSAQVVELADGHSPVGPPGQCTIATQPADNGKQQLTLQANNLSLGVADAGLRRYVSGIEISGTLSGQGTAEWTPAGGTLPADLTTSGTLAIEQLDATAPALSGDRIRLPMVEMPWRLAAKPDALQVELLQLRSDVGQAALRGTIDLRAMTQSRSAPPAGAPATADALAPHDVQLRSSLDLARLATMLPHVLKIRDDTSITSGTIQLDAHAQPADGGQLITGSLQASQLAATSAGRPLTWDQPVSAHFTLRRQHGALQLDALQCDSDFLTVHTSGTPQQMAATAQFDLDRLAQRLSQFLDLGGTRLAGTGSAKLDWQRTGPDQYSAQASGELSQLRIALGESQIAAGQSSLAAKIGVAGDSVDISGAEFVARDLQATRPGWNINEPQVRLTADARWNRQEHSLAVDDAQLVTSTVSLAAKDGRYQAGQLAGVAAFRGDLARLAAWRAAAPTPSPYQPSGQLTGNLRIIQQGDRLTSELTATGQNLALAQLANSNVPAANRAIAGPGQNHSPAYQTIWQEPQLALRCLATYESPADRLTFDQLQIQSNTLQASVSGQIARLTTAADTQLNGTLNYDLAQVTPLLRPYVGDGIQLAGREQARFALVGAIKSDAALSAQQVGLSNQSTIRDPQTAIAIPRTLRAQLELPWSGANVYGLPIGPGKLAAALDGGAVRVEPLDLAVGEGRLTASPHIRLEPPPAELNLPQGPLITNVRISPEVSEAMLKYVAPVLAGATRSEGVFSMALDGARVPLGAPKRADAAGQLTVHSVRVVPGPMAQQWVGLAQQIESLARRRDPAAQTNRQQVTLLSVNDQQVNFRVVDGRVYHQNMEFQVGDVVLRSQGSVGFDETVALTLTVPIQEKWIAGEPLLAGLRGQSLQIPISGTLTRPQMDQRAIAGLTQQLLQGAAQNAIGGELNKALDKLFKSR